jgi:hypothetical protein
VDDLPLIQNDGNRDPDQIDAQQVDTEALRKEAVRGLPITSPRRRSSDDQPDHDT